MTTSSTNDSFVKDFRDLLCKLRSSKAEHTADKRSPLSSVLDGQPFTKQSLEEESFGIHNFATRCDAEEVEWFLNKPIDNGGGNTCVHEAVLSQNVDKLDLILKLGGN